MHGDRHRPGARRTLYEEDVPRRPEVRRQQPQPQLAVEGGDQLRLRRVGRAAWRRLYDWAVAATDEGHGVRSDSFRSRSLHQ